MIGVDIKCSAYQLLILDPPFAIWDSILVPLHANFLKLFAQRKHLSPSRKRVIG